MLGHTRVQLNMLGRNRGVGANSAGGLHFEVPPLCETFEPLEGVILEDPVFLNLVVIIEC